MTEDDDNKVGKAPNSSQLADEPEEFDLDRASGPTDIVPPAADPAATSEQTPAGKAAATTTDIANIAAPEQSDTLPERMRKRAIEARPHTLGNSALNAILQQDRIGGLERTMRNLGLGRTGASALDRIAAGGLGGLSATEKAVLGVGTFADQAGLATWDKALGLGFRGGGTERFLVGQHERERLLSRTIAGFTDRSAFTSWATPRGGGDVARWAEYDAILKPLGGLGRDQRWAKAITGGSLSDLVEKQASRGILAGQADAISRAAQELMGGIAGRASALTPQLDALINRHATFEPTAHKLSLFAGALDIVGPGPASTAAFEALLGEWRTTTDLPESFWRHPEQRLRRYRDADVDAGLIDADNAELVEMLVETGVVEGERRDGRTSALVEAGPVTVRVTTTRPRQGASRVLAAFELGMRGFVEAKLRAALAADGGDPEKWFKQRMPGDIVKRARERQEAARLAGEPPAPPIAFIDLGDFIDIVTQRSNWPVFEPVFGSAEGFRVDLTRLNAIRRPIAHLRKIDPVQLAETTLTVARLTKAIALYGDWEHDWDDEP